jgi:hypothetical protein
LKRNAWVSLPLGEKGFQLVGILTSSLLGMPLAALMKAFSFTLVPVSRSKAALARDAPVLSSSTRTPSGTSRNFSAARSKTVPL